MGEASDKSGFVRALVDAEQCSEDPGLPMQIRFGDAEHLAFANHLHRLDPSNHRPRCCAERGVFRAGCADRCRYRSRQRCSGSELHFSSYVDFGRAGMERRARLLG